LRVLFEIMPAVS